MLTIPPLATEVLNSVPYILGPILGAGMPIAMPQGFVPRADRDPTWGDAFRVMWPLEMVLYSPVTSIEQAEAARLVLGYIGNQLCIRQALSSWD